MHVRASLAVIRNLILKFMHRLEKFEKLYTQKLSGLYQK